MKVYDATSIRNVAVVGHGGCGKTQLVSAMLFGAGTVNRLGRVDDGSTVTDFDDEAIARDDGDARACAHRPDLDVDRAASIAELPYRQRLGNVQFRRRAPPDPSGARQRGAA